MRRAAWVVCFIVLGGCGGEDPGGVDGGSDAMAPMDAAVMDGAVRDAAARDAAVRDSAVPDAAVTDAGESRDGGLPSDAGPSGDAGLAGRALGTVVDDGDCMRTVGEGTCERVVVQCPETSDLTAELRVRMATSSPAVGWVLLASRQRGTDWFDDTQGGDTFMAELRAAGLHVIERAWDDNGWFGTTEAESTLAAQACRLATLVDHVSRTYATALPLCAHGHSGGSMELATAVAYYPIDDVLTYFSVSGGPYHDLFEVCSVDDASGWFPGRCETQLTTNLSCGGTLRSRNCDTDKEEDLNRAFGTARSPCVGRGGTGSASAADRALLEQSSILGPDANRRFGSTVGITIGVGECSGLGAGAFSWRDALEAAGTTVVLPAGGSIGGGMVRHNVFATPDGTYTAGPIVDLFETHCR